MSRERESIAVRSLRTRAESSITSTLMVMSHLEQIDLTRDRRLIEPVEVALLFRAELRGACAQMTNAHAPAAREVLDVTRADVAGIFRGNFQTFLPQELAHELEMARADVAELRHHEAAA